MVHLDFQHALRHCQLYLHAPDQGRAAIRRGHIPVPDHRRDQQQGDQTRLAHRQPTPGHRG